MTSREQGSKEFVVRSIGRFNKVLESAGPDTGLGVGLELKGFEAKSVNKGDKITLHASC